MHYYICNSLLFKTFCWYGFTIISTISSKKYLIAKNDPYLLSITSFFYGFCFLIISGEWSSFIRILSNKDKKKSLFNLTLLHIATTLLTNTGLLHNLISLTYIIKVSLL
jgi:hypothetical protein